MQEQINKDQPIKKTKTINKRNIIIKLCWVFGFILLGLSIARVPYIGQLIDGLFFSFILGYAKYILYGYLLIVFTCKIFNIKWKQLYSLRTIAFMTIITVIVCIFLGGLQIAVFPRDENLISLYVNEIWLNTMFKFSDQFIFGTNYYIDGGIIGVLIASISGVFIILFAIFAGVFVYFIIFKNHWFWVKNKILFKNIKKMTSEQKSNLVSTLTPETPAQPTTLKPKNAYLNTLLNETNEREFNLDYTLESNHIDLEQEKQVLINFFTENKITVGDLVTSETEQKYLLTVKADANMYQRIEQLKDYMNLIGLNKDYNLIISAESFVIEYPKFKHLLNLGLIKLLTSKIYNPLEFTSFLDVNNQPALLNLQTDYFIGVFSNNNREIENYINILIASLSAKYDSKYLDICVISPVSKNFMTIKTKNSLDLNIVDIASLDSFLTKIQTQIDSIASKIKETKVTDIYELNNVLKNPIKNHFIIIDQLDFLKANNSLLFNKICALQKLATLCGFSFICIDRSKTGVSFDDINYSNVVVFNYDSYLAKKLLDKNYKVSAADRNMSFLYSPNKKIKIEKIFIPQANDAELKILTEKLQ